MFILKDKTIINLDRIEAITTKENYVVFKSNSAHHFLKYESNDAAEAALLAIFEKISHV
jgi:hypothetical protein